MGLNPGGSLNPQVVASTELVLTGPFNYTWDTFADGDATPSVSAGYAFKTANTAPTVITDFDDPNPNGQSIIVLFTDGNTTIQDVSNGSNIRLEGGIDFDSAAYDMMEFEYDGANWVGRGKDLK